MRKVDQFYIFESLQELEDWLSQQHITRKITRIQEHHTYLPDYNSFKGDMDGLVEDDENHIRITKSIDYYHEHTNGWQDSGHHFLVFPDGVIISARSLNLNPAGIKGANTGSICIENVGNFDKDTMTLQQQKSTIGLAGLLALRFNIKPNANTIIYHHWFDLNTGKRTNGSGTVKTCPGKNFFGGNKVSDAEKNFIPKVKKFMVERNLEEIIGMFKDIDNASEWAKDKINRAKELGIINGDNLGNFNPKDGVTREALAVVAVNIYDAIMRDIK